jgi:hypothetical protein
MSFRRRDKNIHPVLLMTTSGEGGTNAERSHGMRGRDNTQEAGAKDTTGILLDVGRILVGIADNLLEIIVRFMN